MRLDGKRESENVVDLTDGQNRSRGKKAAVGGGIGALVIAAIAMFMSGGDVSQLLNMFLQTQAGGVGSGGGTMSSIREDSPEAAALKKFTSQVLGDTEDTWQMIFRNELDRPYEMPLLTTFADQVNTACQPQTAAVGPFYCPADKTIYIDLTFFHELAMRHHAKGDFAQAYVIAHEVAHHVQNITNVSRLVQEGKARARSKAERNQWSVRQELHADFLAGVWAYHAREKNLLERGDLEEALNAARQIGDDTLQKRARGRVTPHTFTHGSAAQRKKWFQLGFDTGEIAVGNQLFELPYDQI